MTENLPDILTIQETSAYLRIPLRSLYKIAQEGKIPCQKVGKHWRFRKQALDDWLEAYPNGEPARQLDVDSPIHSSN